VFEAATRRLLRFEAAMPNLTCGLRLQAEIVLLFT